MKSYPDKPRLIRATLRAMGWKPFLVGLLLVPVVSEGDLFYLLINKINII
jgi:hypothetical protein